MKLHADLSQAASVDSRSIDWIDSPASGVQRRMLDKDGGEDNARASTIVRFQPGSAFPEHVHKGGEEFLVLDGVFSDETGDFPTGMYVRNPPGSRHSPATRLGCTIFVKLMQMSDDDKAFVRVDTHNAELWQDGLPGEKVLPLHQHAAEQVELLHWQAGCELESQIFPGGAEYLVLDGEFSDEQGSYGPGHWLRLPAGSRQTIHSRDGARVYRKQGHLAS